MTSRPGPAWMRVPLTRNAPAGGELHHDQPDLLTRRQPRAAGRRRGNATLTSSVVSEVTVRKPGDPVNGVTHSRSASVPPGQCGEGPVGQESGDPPRPARPVPASRPAGPPGASTPARCWTASSPAWNPTSASRCVSAMTGLHLPVVEVFDPGGDRLEVVLDGEVARVVAGPTSRPAGPAGRPLRPRGWGRCRPGPRR